MPTSLLRLLATLAVLGLSLTLLTALREPPPPPEPTPEPTPAPTPLEVGEVRHRLRTGETLGAVLGRYGVRDVVGVVAAARPEQDLAKVRAGRELRLRFRRGLEQAVAVGYPLDEDSVLWVIREGDRWRSEVERVQYEAREATRAFEIRETLWQAATEAGLRAADITRLAQIFEYEVDFNTELRAGARVALVLDEFWTGGAFVKPGDIHAVTLINAAERWTYFAFEGRWYAPDGTARRRQFLRSPLEFSRVTSGFNPRRFHPIARQVRAHKGTDFGAPSGTPVRATADGLVTTAGRNGGHGLYVKLDHDGPYHTSYSHLSRIQVKRGQRVEQGQVIGRVGTTGASTGPHLHYEFHISGKPVDALKHVPDSGRPVPDGRRADFDRDRDRLGAMLEQVLQGPILDEDQTEG